jgi:hypothetical protein
MPRNSRPLSADQFIAAYHALPPQEQSKVLDSLIDNALRKLPCPGRPQTAAQLLEAHQSFIDGFHWLPPKERQYLLKNLPLTPPSWHQQPEPRGQAQPARRFSEMTLEEKLATANAAHAQAQAASAQAKRAALEGRVRRCRERRERLATAPRKGWMTLNEVALLLDNDPSQVSRDAKN